MQRKTGAACFEDSGCIELTANHGSENEEGGCQACQFETDSKRNKRWTICPGRFRLALSACNITRCLCRVRTIQKTGCKIKKSPNSGGMMGLAFIYDPDGYLVEILPKQNPFPQQDTDCNGVSLNGGDGYKDNSRVERDLP